MVWSIENGARDNYGRPTLRAVEAAYMLAPGSLDRTLAGGPLEPAEAQSPPLRPAVIRSAPGPDDDFLASVLSMLAPEDRAQARGIAALVPLLSDKDREVVRAILLRMVDGENRPWPLEQKLGAIEDYAAGVVKRRAEAGLRIPFPRDSLPFLSNSRARASARSHERARSLTNPLIPVPPC